MLTATKAWFLSIKAWFMGIVTVWVIPNGGIGLFLMAFAESSFFPIPPDFALIPLALINPSGAYWLALYCTLGSVLGGMFGYGLGKWGGRPVLLRFVDEKRIQSIHELFEKYEAWAIAIAGFTPIPYKVFTISAGMFAVNFRIFVLASVLSRGARFFIVAGLIHRYGEQIRPFLQQHFDKISLGLVILLVGGFFCMRWVMPKKSGNQAVVMEEGIGE